MATVLFLFSIWTGSEENVKLRFWVVVSIALVMGLVLGFILPRLTKLGLAIAGGALGFFISMILYGTLFFNIPSSPAELLFNNFMILGSGLGIILGYEFSE